MNIKLSKQQLKKIKAVKWSESKRNEANASRNHENEVSQWAERILHPHSIHIHSSQEIDEKENDVCIHTLASTRELINHFELHVWACLQEHEHYMGISLKILLMVEIFLKLFKILILLVKKIFLKSAEIKFWRKNILKI